MNRCETCSSKDKCTSKEQCSIKHITGIKKIIGVMSGKGGVGKSTFSALLAKGLKAKGFKVGLVDTDIMGPSIPRMMGCEGIKAYATKEKLIPVETKDGIKIMSMNLLLDNETDPIIWRGALISNMVNQFFTDVDWGELDYLIIDMPPGTGDVALTVMQSVPIDGMVLVTVPQDFISMIVSKSINMVEKMNKKVVGIIENMSYIKCPNCDEIIKMNNESDIKKYTNNEDIEVLEEFPMDIQINKLYEKDIESFDDEIKNKIDNLVNKIQLKIN